MLTLPVCGREINPPLQRGDLSGPTPAPKLWDPDNPPTFPPLPSEVSGGLIEVKIKDLQRLAQRDPLWLGSALAVGLVEVVA